MNNYSKMARTETKQNKKKKVKTTWHYSKRKFTNSKWKSYLKIKLGFGKMSDSSRILSGSSDNTRNKKMVQIHSYIFNVPLIFWVPISKINSAQNGTWNLYVLLTTVSPLSQVQLLLQIDPQATLSQILSFLKILTSKKVSQCTYNPKDNVNIYVCLCNTHISR